LNGNSTNTKFWATTVVAPSAILKVQTWRSLYTGTLTWNAVVLCADGNVYSYYVAGSYVFSQINQTGTFIKDMVASYDAIHMIDTNNVVWSWGTNDNGALGDGTNTNQYTLGSPVVTSTANVTSGGYFINAYGGYGIWYKASDNNYYYAGWNGLAGGQTLPVNLYPTFTAPTWQVVASVYNSYFFSSTQIFGAGDNSYGQLKTFPNPSTGMVDITPTLNPGETIIQMMALLGCVFCLTSSKRVLGIGNNGLYQLGDNTNTNRNNWILCKDFSSYTNVVLTDTCQALTNGSLLIIADTELWAAGDPQAGAAQMTKWGNGVLNVYRVWAKIANIPSINSVYSDPYSSYSIGVTIPIPMTSTTTTTTKTSTTTSTSKAPTSTTTTTTKTSTTTSTSKAPTTTTTSTSTTTTKTSTTTTTTSTTTTTTPVPTTSTTSSTSPGP